jgi:hypothetical protein
LINKSFDGSVVISVGDREMMEWFERCISIIISVGDRENDDGVRNQVTYFVMIKDQTSTHVVKVDKDRYFGR